MRADGTKDHWSIQVWKIRPRGRLVDVILLDGSRSQEWSYSAGANVAAQYMKQYRTPYFISEQPKSHHEYMVRACQEAKTPLRMNPDRSPLQFADYNKADGKNARFFKLADKARNQEVWICNETCSDELLYGDGEHTGVLTQARKHRKTAPGKTSLRFDDDIDVAGRVMDENVQKLAPLAHDEINETLAAILGEDEDSEDYEPMSRYCGV
jgi:hypothetical protein